MDLSYIFIFAVGLVAAFFGTLVGGGGLLILITLVNLGVPPHTAIGTNRIGVSGSGIGGWYKFHRMKKIDYRLAVITAIPTVIGAVVGANILLTIDQDVVRKMIGIITLSILVLFIFNPKAGLKKLQKNLKKRHYAAGIIASFFIGIYGGMFSGGTGTLQSYLLILLFGQTFIQSAATRKIANLLLSLGGGAVYFLKGAVDIEIAAILFVSTLLGSYLGAHYSEKLGNIWIKRLFIVVVALLSLRILIS